MSRCCPLLNNEAVQRFLHVNEDLMPVTMYCTFSHAHQDAVMACLFLMKDEGVKSSGAAGVLGTRLLTSLTEAHEDSRHARSPWRLGMICLEYANPPPLPIVLIQELTP